MKFLYLKSRLSLFILALCLITCTQDKIRTSLGGRRVCIKKVGAKFVVFKDGKPFLIKGASGFTHLGVLKRTGGNTIRVWDTLGLRAILDSADRYQLSVIVGLPMPASENMDGFYNDDVKTKDHIRKIALIVNEFKNRPSLLFWCIGNELAFPYKPKYRRFYKTLNDIVSLIHTNDPDHPVTTTLISVQPKNIFNIKFRTDIDFLSFNLFGGFKTFSEDIKKVKWFWTGPFLITEWGIEGPWSADIQNAWGSYVEATSTKKAEQYLEVYEKYMPLNDPGFLGSLVFYWGQKQEYTPTWFSFFDEKGMKTEVVNTMEEIWTGKKTILHAPSLNYMLIDNKGAMDNIFLKPNANATGKLLLAQQDSLNLSYHWHLYKEDWHKPNGVFSEKKPKELANLLIQNTGKEINFKVPYKEGPYRLFVSVYNKQGFLATANTPFYVIAKP
jgi:hypothetical protein